MRLLFLPLLILAACNALPSAQPTLDIRNLPGILPTIEPTQLAAVAQLADEATLTHGAQVYQTHCAACHGSSGAGQFPDNPMQPDSTGRYGAPPHNENGHTWHHDDALLLNYVRDGGMGSPDQFYPMPAFGSVLTDEEIAAVVAYLKTFWTEEQRFYQAERSIRAEED